MSNINSVLSAALFNTLNLADPESIERLFFERHLAKGQVLFYQGDPGEHMYIVKSGVLQIYLEEHSKLIVVGHQFPGETVGELEVIHHDNHRLASVSAVEESTVWVIRKSDLENLFDQYPLLLRRLFYVVNERLGQANRKISYLAFLSTRMRVVNLLLDLQANFGHESDHGVLIDWHLTHQHFAQMIGVNRESATRTLQELQREEIIQIESKRITILKPQLLQTMASLDTYPFVQRQWHSHAKYAIPE